MENKKWYYWTIQIWKSTSAFKTDDGKKVTESDEIY